MSRTDNTRPLRLLEERDHPLAYWHDRLQTWVLPYWVLNQPPHWYVRHVWNAPERVRERAQLGEMVKEYNAAGELEDGDFANYRHRHCAHWYWW